MHGDSGHGEWEHFFYTINDGSKEYAVNFDHPTLKPQVSVRVRKKPKFPDHHHHALLRIDLIDKYDNYTDSIMPNKFVLTEDWQEFTFDFTGTMINIYGTSFVGFGPLDDRNIKALKFQINSGWYSYPDTIDNIPYSNFFMGDVEFDWIKVGQGTSEIIGMALSQVNPLVKLFVNPSNSTLRIDLNNIKSRKVTVSIYNVLGKLVTSDSFNDLKEKSLRYDLTGYCSGVYMLRITTGEKVITDKFLLSK